MLSRVHNVHQYETKNRSYLYVPLANTNVRKFSFAIRGPEILRDSENKIKLCKTLAGFKYNLKKYLLSQYV